MSAMPRNDGAFHDLSAADRLLLLSHSSRCNNDSGACSVSSHCNDMKKLWKHLADCWDEGCGVTHCFASRRLLTHYRECTDSRCGTCTPVREATSKSEREEIDKSGNGDRDAWQRRVRLKQERLLLLHHSSRCERATCTATANCQFFKNLWKHMAHCKNNSCGEAQCFSSRAILSHYRKCKDEHCPCCEGVRKVVRGDWQNAEAILRLAQLSDPLASLVSPKLCGPVGYLSEDGSLHSESQIDRSTEVKKRLLLLRHASQCSDADGSCLTPHCSRMRQVWKHVQGCKDPTCTVSLCRSSRIVISHDRRRGDECSLLVAVPTGHARESRKRRMPKSEDEDDSEKDSQRRKRQLMNVKFTQPSNTTLEDNQPVHPKTSDPRPLSVNYAFY